MNTIGHWLDNPLFLKHVRSRLRRSQLLSPIVVVVALCLLIAWWAGMTNHFADGLAANAYFGLQAITLVFVGGSQVSTSLGAARQSGILDFHRISPLRPSSVAFGFFLGAPVREYLLALIPIPFLLYCVIVGKPSVADFLQIQAALLLGTWLFHVMALLTALVSRKPTKSGGAGLVIFGVIFFSNMVNWLSTGPSGPEQDGFGFRFFGVQLPWLLWMALYSLPLTAFGLLAATRKIRSERAHILSKPQAAGFLVTLTFLTLGGFINASSLPFVDATILYLLCGFGLLTSLAIVPSLGEYARGLRRAQRQGRVHLSAWNDLALNRVALAVLCGIVLLGASIVNWREQNDLSRPPHFSLAVAVAVLTIAYFGLAHQWLALTMTNRAGSMLALFLFFAWVVPLLGAVILAVARIDSPVKDALFGFTPISALGLLGFRQDQDVSEISRIAALVPAIGFPFLFNNLITARRRKIDAAVRDGEPVVKPPPDPLLVEA